MQIWHELRACAKKYPKETEEWSSLFTLETYVELRSFKYYLFVETHKNNKGSNTSAGNAAAAIELKANISF